MAGDTSVYNVDNVDLKPPYNPDDTSVGAYLSDLFKDIPVILGMPFTIVPSIGLLPGKCQEAIAKKAEKYVKIEPVLASGVSANWELLGSFVMGNYMCLKSAGMYLRGEVVDESIFATQNMYEYGSILFLLFAVDSLYRKKIAKEGYIGATPPEDARACGIGEGLLELWCDIKQKVKTFKDSGKYDDCFEMALNDMDF